MKFKRILCVILSVLCVFSMFSISVSAADKTASYGGKYGTITPVKSDGKTSCSSYTVNGDSAKLKFLFKSKGYKENVFYAIKLYSDEARKNALVERSGAFPTVDSVATLSVDFSKLKSQTYYGTAYTYRKSGANYITDKDSQVLFDVKVNKVAASTVKVTEAQALYTGNYIKWNKVKYADKYRVYRKTSLDASWKKLVDTQELEYLDKTAVRGQKYYYTVKAFDGSAAGKTNTNAVELIYLSAPKFNGAPERLADNAVKISWSEVDGATKYRIYRRSADESVYTALATVSAEITEYTDTSAKINGTVFYYKVRAINGTVSGVTSSAAKVTVFGTFVPTLSANGKSVTVKWSEVKGADSYTVFKKVNDGEWQILAECSDITEYTDTDVVADNKYSYSLTVLKNGEYSSFNTIGASIYLLKEPKISSVNASVDNSVLVKWQAVKGATKYSVYRKSDSDNYKLIGTSTGTSFYDTTEKKNNLYYTYYIKAEAENSVSLFGNKTASLHFMCAPENITVSNGTVKWSRVSGATGYKIFRKSPGGSYKEIGEIGTSSLKFVDATAKKNSQYYYTVAAMNGNTRGAYLSGKGVNCLDAVKITGVSTVKNGGAKVQWSKVSGASGYYVYRKTAGGNWTRLTKTTSLSYTDTSSRKSGTEYFYTVRAYNASGAGIYDIFGVSHIYLSTPEVVSAKKQKDGSVLLEWKSVKGATNYRVYRKTENGSLKCLNRKITAESYTDKTAEKGNVYYYRVYAENNGSLSGYTEYKVKT